MEKLEDEDVINFGEWNGTELEHVPENWLRWFYDENKLWFDHCQRDKNEYKKALTRKHMSLKYRLMLYIEDAIDNL